MQPSFQACLTGRPKRQVKVLTQRSRHGITISISAELTLQCLILRSCHTMGLLGKYNHTFRSTCCITSCDHIHEIPLHTAKVGH